MSIDSQTRLQNEKNSPEEHVQEVNSLLGDIEAIADKSPNTSYDIEAERTTAYQDENDWEKQTGMIRGYAPLEDDEGLTDPEQHAKGSQILKEQHGIDKTSVANINIDGIGELSSVTAEYSIDLDFEEGKGLNYEVERKDVNANNIEDQPGVQQDLEYLETQMDTILEEYNEPETQQHTASDWVYGEQRVQALGD